MASKKEKTHLLDARGDAYLRMMQDRQAVTLCGADLWYREKTEDRKGTIVRRLDTVSIAAAEGLRTRPLAPKANKCRDCLKLAKLTADERKAWHENKARAFEKLQEQAKAKRAAELAVLDAEIVKARGDALACLDAWHELDGKVDRERQLPKRCNRIVLVSRCHMSAKHNGPCETHDADGNLIELALDFETTLDMAIKAHKREHGGDAGKRLWKFQPIEVDKNDGTNARISADKLVCCRFCTRIMGQGRIGFDYSHHTFTLAQDTGVAKLNLPGFSSDQVDVREHTVVCALRYLAQVKITTLPDQSFVLDHDDQPEEINP
jgi:hypothetical protein